MNNKEIYNQSFVTAFDIDAVNLQWSRGWNSPMLRKDNYKIPLFSNSICMVAFVES